VIHKHDIDGVAYLNEILDECGIVRTDNIMKFIASISSESNSVLCVLIHRHFFAEAYLSGAFTVDELERIALKTPSGGVIISRRLFPELGKYFEQSRYPFKANSQD
jgi:hypothetical protein